MFRLLSTGILFGAVLFLAFFIRIQGTPNIPAGQFAGTDAYLYYWQAQLISENGELPARDMHRWLPLGRDLGQTLNAYSYALAYVQKLLTFFDTKTSLYHITLYAPTVFFVIGLGVLCIFLYYTKGLLFASIVGGLLATLPGSIERSIAGFSDRDSWCLMLGILAIITYLTSLQTHHLYRKLLWTLVSGFIVFLGGISWEGFGVFISIILIVEIWRFLSSEIEEGFGYYLLWVCCFVPTLYLASPAYQSGYGFAKHLFAFVLVPPCILLSIRCCRFLLLSKVSTLRPYTKIFSLGLVLGSLALILGYIWVQFDSLVNTAVPLSQSNLMQNVIELNAPTFQYWMSRYGLVFIYSCIGIFIASNHLSKKGSIILAGPLILFCVTTFFRQPLDALCGTSLGTLLFLFAGCSSLIGFILLAWTKAEHSRNDLISVVMIVWFITWVALARDAKRYDFFIGVPIAFFTAKFIYFFSKKIIKVLSQNFSHQIPYTSIRNGTIIALLLLLMFFPPIVAHTYRVHYAATYLQKASPGTTDVAKAFRWMKAELADTAIVAAPWSYGSQLNVLGGVKTIIDQDHYIHYWIELFNTHIRDATDALDSLEFLKTHNVTHLMLTQRQPPEVFIQGKLSTAFVPVYPKSKFIEATIKVWRIDYPSNIQPKPKYLATDPEH